MKRRAAVLVLVWAVLSLTAYGLITAYKAPKYYFSPYQPTPLIHKEYLECKAKAPPGFDCIMQPVMVSNEFIKAQYQ